MILARSPRPARFAFARAFLLLLLFLEQQQKQWFLHALRVPHTPLVRFCYVVVVAIVFRTTARSEPNFKP